jgi:DNA repair exonuclease SbcCD ATPase subunit
LKARQTFAKELKTKVTEVNSQFTTLREKQRNLKRLVDRDNAIVQRAMSETKAAAAAIETESAKLSQTAPNRVSQQQQRIERAKEEHRRRVKAEQDAGRRIAESGITQVHTILRIRFWATKEFAGGHFGV